MKVHEQRLFRIPIDELRSYLKKAHSVDLSGVEPSIEGEFIVFALNIETASTAESGPLPSSKLQSEVVVESSVPRIRRRRRKRNRIKTRGWKVLGKITNSQGLVANVYEPFVSALKGVAVPRSEQRRIVRQIMVRNRNTPTDESVEYFLENTLEYLRSRASKPEAQP